MKPKPNFLGALVCAAAAADQSALLCAASIALPATASGEMMFMPGGKQTITPFGGGIGQPIEVWVDAHGAAQLEQQRAALLAKGKRPYFDFEHEDNGASYWVESFYWKDGPEPGIYCRGQWTKPGKEGVEGLTWRAFSPVFHVDNKRAKPAQIICNAAAVPNMGGLVNNPAFSNISPLWAKNAGGAQSANPEQTHIMTPEELAALQAKNTELTNELARLKTEQTAIKAKNENDELVSARIEAKEAQLKATAAELETAALKAKSASQETEIAAQRSKVAKEVVGAAVARGAIAAKDTDTIAAWEKDITENPERGALLAKMGGNPAIGGQRLTQNPGTGARVTAEAPKAIMREYGALVAKNASIPLSAATAAEKGELARQAAAIFAADINKNPALASMSMHEAIMAADYTDPNANLGLLSGSLALQRSLPLMLTQLPILGSITTDFSDEPGLLNQTTNTRIVLKPAVQTYDPTLAATGRPNGWTTASPAQTVDVPVTLDTYAGIPIVFGAATLAQTTRKLFDETAPLAINAMGEYAVGKLSALMTAANFNGYVGTTLAAGATTSGSPTVTVTSTAGAYAGQRITGTGIPANTLIASITNGTTLVLSKNATATNTGLTFTLMNSGKVPTTYVTYIKAQASFGVADLDLLASAFDINDVPMNDRFAALSPAYYRKLGGDSNVLALMQGSGDASYLTDRRLPKMSNFELQNAPWFPQTSNRTGFAGHKASLVLKTRLPSDLTSALPGVSFPGSVTTVTDPGSGLTMLLVQYYDPTGGYAEWRPEILLGASVGDRRAGLVITSA